MKLDAVRTVPAARFERLVVTETQNEVLVFDQVSNHIHHLNDTSAAVWRLCDGARSVTDIALATGLTNDMVKVALGKLADARLLEGELAADLRTGQSRRSFMKKAAVAGGLAIPAIASVSAPTAATGVSSYPGDCNKACTKQSDCNNCCSQCNGMGGSSGCAQSAPEGVCVHPTYCLDVTNLGVSCNPR